jgi:hypothetical protein
MVGANENDVKTSYYNSSDKGDVEGSISAERFGSGT